MAGLEKLEEIYEKTFGKENCIMLHPGTNRNYTEEELKQVKSRDFESRLMILATQCAGDTVFVRTHHTDNLQHASFLNHVRDYLKAAHSTHHATCAKATLTSLLTMSIQLEASDYCSFATTLASGLSRCAQNTMFEINRNMVKNEEEIEQVRIKYCILMDTLFNKMAIKRFLLDDGKSNIFRLVFCDVAHRRTSKTSVVVAGFSFVLQMCLTLYVTLENYHTPYDDYFDHPEMLPLALFTLVYSLMVGIPTAMEARRAHTILYKGIYPMLIMDYIVNAFLPMFLAVSGFIIILGQNDFIDAVLNVTALLFIPEIDDHLSVVLGVQDEDIINNYLIASAIKDFENFPQISKKKDLNRETLRRRNMVCCGQFGDFFITNLPEEGNNPQKGVCYQPYQVTKSHRDFGHQIDPSTVVTKACLLQKIEWKFTTGFPYATKPRIGLLRLTKITGEVVEIKRKEDPTGLVGISPDPFHVLEGMYVVTSFQMSEDVIKLRVCGSDDPLHFLRGFEYYSLWDVASDAERAIRRHVRLRNNKSSLRSSLRGKQKRL